MASYTIELRKVCDIYTREEVENWFKDYELTDFLTQEEKEVIQNSNIWSKDRLARKIVDHYFMREIGLETPALFKLKAKVAMQEIMESKLPLIYSNSLKYDPLINVDYTETFERNIKGDTENAGSSNSNSNQNASGLNVNSDTPQGQISKQGILQGDYASSTNASETESNIKDSTTTNSNSNSNTDETYKRNVKGNQGITASYQKMVEQFRDNIVSIDRDIIKELNSLFMGLY